MTVLTAGPSGETELIELTHPGQILNEEFLNPMGITAYRLSKEIGVQQTRISEILKGKRDISAETAVLLGTFFGMSIGFWSRLQADYDNRKARRALQERLSHIKPVALEDAGGP